ncbi:MAG: hypothetical protein IT213_08680 [Cytophagales bacterium]|jgi:hypothetical protein|nr:hypothetical protein [Cytophagales bacterium]
MIDLMYPAVHLLKDGLVYGIVNDQKMKTASLSLLNVFTDSLVVDSLGNQIKIKNAYKTGWGTIIWGFHPLIKGRLVKVDFSINDSSKISLADFKEVIIERLQKKYPKQFYFFSSKEKLLEKVAQALSYREVIELFLYDVGND